MRILIIEDSEPMMHLHLRTFRGHEVEGAATFKDGLRKALAFHPNIIVTDLRLQDQSERDTAENITLLKQAAPAAAVIVASGHFDAEIAEVALRSGAVHFIDKNNSRLTARLLDAVETIGRGPDMDDVLRIAKEVQQEQTPSE